MTSDRHAILSMLDSYSGFSLLLLLVTVVAGIWRFRSLLLHHPGWMHFIGLLLVLAGYGIASMAAGPLATMAASGGFLSFGVSMLAASFTVLPPVKVESKPSAHEIYLQERIDHNNKALEEIRVRRMAPLHKELKLKQVSQFQVRLILAKLKAQEDRLRRDGGND